MVNADSHNAHDFSPPDGLDENVHFHPGTSNAVRANFPTPSGWGSPLIRYASVYFRGFMKTICRVVMKFALGLFLVVSFNNAQAALINGDFQTGNLSNWTTFTTANGTLGSGRPTISNFDVAGNGLSSSALALSVGYLTPPCSFPGIYCPLPTEGGGIKQTANFSGGLTLLQADVAVANSTLYGGFNLDGGTFSLFLDGLLVNSFSIGAITAGTVQRGHLTFTAFLSAGLHTLEILVTRQHLATQSLTQYIDNVSAIPEPTTTSLFGLGMLALLVSFTKPRKAHIVGRQ